MSEAVFRAHIEQIWNNQDAGAIERFIAPGYLGTDPAGPDPISGVEGYKKHFETLITAFPDTHITIEDVVAVENRDGNRVAARFSVEATHSGDFGGSPPTGIRVNVAGMSVVRIVNRQLVEEHAITDTLGLLKQIGVIPEPPQIPAFFF